MIVNSLEQLQQHRLMHSITKKFPCRVCKKKGFSREHDRKRHEVKCCEKNNVKIADGIVVPLSEEGQDISVKRNLFPTEQLMSGAQVKTR